MKGILTRFAYLPNCTLGWMEYGPLRLATMERPWIPNPKGAGGMPKRSCVPDGQYRVMPFSGSKFTDVYCLANELLGVWPTAVPNANDGWGRAAILIHAGNTVDNVIGCIAVGDKHVMQAGEHIILNSKAALAKLCEFLGKTNHTLQIRPSYGTQN